MVQADSMKMDDEKETTMTKKTNKTTAPKTTAPLLDGQPRRSTAADAPPPPPSQTWPYGGDAPRKGRVIVTPEMARGWLEANRNNRRLKVKCVERIAKDIKAGQWIYTGQSITFSETWRLLDGQHRLIAIANCGIACEALVETNVDDAAMSKTDTGGAGSRSPATAWCTSNNVEEHKDITARVNACFAALVGEIPRTSGEFGEAYEAFIDGVNGVMPQFAAHRAGLGRASIAAAFAIVWKESPAAVLAAAESYITGANLPPKHPMLVLRNSSLRASSERRTGGGTRARTAETHGALSLVLAAVQGKGRTQSKGAAPAADIERLREAHGL